MILASDWQDYCKYAESIRQEYPELSFDEFREGRIDFLKLMLARPMIFPSADFEVEENAARKNMQKEIELLRSSDE